ncbi:TonB-dependent receptor [Pseudoduganella sp. FT93W]|uniref:TonB-dependent receptor n=1 Tax=Duganella fentianensis TaxID=2692177 RepID=A0A845HZM9_9BURK|nr:TonB-dependent receptor [Duganella fentianensis]MYN44336.1 TonB-dependent receptor [Duganella fentianensis]
MLAFSTDAGMRPASACLRPATAAVQCALWIMLGAQPLHAGAQDAPTLGEILVQSTRVEAGSAGASNTVVLSAEQLSRNNASDMANIARYAPLVSVPSAASGGGNIWDGACNTGFNIRGAEGNRVSLTLDGVALPDAAPKPDATSANTFGIGRDYFDPETFREVRIGAGASPAGAGTPGLGGAVAFVTKAPEDYLSGRSLYADLRVGYSGEQAQRSQALTAAARLAPSLQALIVAVHRAGKETDSMSTVLVNPDRWHSDAVLAKLHWQLTPQQRLLFAIDQYQAQHDRLFANKLGASYPEGATQDGSTERTRYSIEHRYAPAALWLFDQITSRLYTQNAAVTDLTRASYITGGQPYLRTISTGYYNHSQGLAFEASKQVQAGWQLAYGASYEQQQARRPWLEDRTVLKTGAHQITMKNRMADMDTDKLALYVRSDWMFKLAGLDATLTPGLRTERRKLRPTNLAAYLIAVPAAAREIRDETDAYVSPSLELALELWPGYSAYASYSRGTRLPTAAERTGTFDSFSYTAAGNGYAVLGNPALQKETSNSYELGLKGAPAAGIELDSSVFYNTYDNLIEYAAQPADPVNYPTITAGLYRPENIGKAQSWGGEVSARVQLGQWQPALQGWSLAAAAGLSRGAAQNRSSGKQGGLPSIQPYKANTSLAYDAAGGRAGMAFTLAGVRGKTASEDVISSNATARFRVPGYSVMDATFYWDLGKHAQLTGGVYNLGDRKYWDYASARSLAAGSTAQALADIERASRPGRNYALNLKVIY